MKTIGVIGLGNMGSGLAKNLIAADFSVPGYDLLPERMHEFKALGGQSRSSSAEVAQGGTLTLMASAPEALMQKCDSVLKAVSGTIHHVGTEPGVGQTVKGCLQSLIGSIFSATFEASVLAAKAGVDADALYKVFSTSAAGCGITNAALGNVIDREFQDTGSHISTMYKDLTISMDLARRHGVPLFTAAIAMQMFQAGITRYPDDQTVARISEEIVGVHLERSR